jgi:hypothetical protein
VLAGRSWHGFAMTIEPRRVGESGRVSLWIALAIVAAGFTLIAFAYWPGVMIDDARWQYQQAVDNQFEDWHPPLMAWVWRWLMLSVMPGPGPMLILQLLLYWAGFALMAWWAYRRGRPRLAIALATVGWLPGPFALTGTVIKDLLMAGCLGTSVGLTLCRAVARSTWVRAALTTGALIALLAAAALRYNAFFACVPLALAAVPSRMIRTWPRWLLTTIVSGAAFLAIGPAIVAATQAEDTAVDLSLIIFDLGGITEQSGVDAFPDMGVKDPVAVNHRCYNPEEWDSYSDWAPVQCPLGFDRFQPMVDDEDFDPKSVWLHAIAAHPAAYAAHRLDHFNREMFFFVPHGPDFTAWSASVDNPWGFNERPNAALRAISGIADAAGATPLGWPFFWLSVALAAFVVAVSARLSAVAQAVAASAFLYGAGYAVVGVATGMRYQVWTVMGAALAAVLVIGELRRSDRWPGRGVIGFTGALVGIPLFIAIAARLGL